MHEEVDFTGLLLAFAIVVLVSLGFVHHVRLQAARQIEVRKLQQIVAAESERAEEEAVEEYSMLATRKHCAVCRTPTKTRCSRCKDVHYCSAACQVKHWKKGHKDECRKSEDTSSVQQVQTSDKLVTTVQVEAIRQPQQVPDPATDTNHVQQYAKVPQEVQVRRRKVDIPNATSDGCLAKPRKILFPYERFVTFYYKFDGQRPPCGLINCGNSCFANVILQCLTYTRPLAAFLLEGTHQRECRRNDWCFMCELQEHVSRVFNNQIPFSPIRILSRLRNIGNHLGYGRQEDAHEFMRFAVDSMQSTCLDEFGGEKAVDPRSQETTLIQYIFGGHLQSQVKCMKCGHESNRYENLMDLAVEIQGAVESLQDGLAQFTAPEWLDGENKYKCDRCNAYVKASKRLTIHEAPNILTIALKRFQSGKFGKLNKRVTFPEALNMSPYMSGAGDKPPIYRLYAVVVHVDMLNASFFGHYICYVRDMSGTWYKVDDSKVKEVDLDKVLAQKAYMLMYSRSSVRPGPEADTGSLASSLTDVSVALPCKYQQKSSSVGQVQSELHRVSPVVAGTLVDNRLVEDTSVGCSTVKDVTDSISCSSSLEGPDQDGRYGRKAGKRRLEEEEELSASSSSSLSRSRSSSCPPVGRSRSASKDGYELADDLPRTFGYSLCARDGDRDRDRDRDRDPAVVASQEQTPTKRQHLLDHRLMVGADEFRGEVIDGNEPNSSNNNGHCSSEGGEKVGNFVEVLPEQVMRARLEDKAESTPQPASSSISRSKASRNSSSSSSVSVPGDEGHSSLRPVFAKGFLNRRMREAGCS